MDRGAWWPIVHGVAKSWTRLSNYIPALFLSGFFGAKMIKNLPAKQKTQVQSLGQEDTLEKEIVTHSNTLA